MTIMEGEDRKDIVIIGGGIVGCTTAYYLTRHKNYDPNKHSITVIEATRIAGGASGKAGGLLAVWAYPNNIVPLSFKLHQDLAIEHGGEETWGYRRVSCGNLEATGRQRSELERLGAQRGVSLGKRGGENRKANRGKSIDSELPKDLDWVMPDLVKSYEKMGGSKETAQVHPYQFTMSMVRLAQERGVRVIIGSVTDIEYMESISGITYTDTQSGTPCTIPATTAILAAGPWTSKLYPSAPISGLRAHSVTITPSSPVSAYALFTEITIPPTPPSPSSSRHKNQPSNPVSPEIYARPNNEIYVCGEGDMEVAVPETTADVQVDEARCDDLIAQVSSVSDHIRLGRVTRKQACYLPILNVGGSGGPLIGETGTEGLLMAAGHSCWGINNAPATGKLLSEIVFEGQAVSADIRQLDPRRIL
ncbi:FAD dependent oxidoreductase [Choiromyces venosus 120613-1]|uniref:FAD dependent oxidoreductase n=1 Tax=Choiromyces venosus 120613-1 TaxID=1336337 RepID=A0A3N4JPI1_9PEZI|nr:FAD dependent oxidoreductase [Choiromyces venosus 120613-1]